MAKEMKTDLELVRTQHFISMIKSMAAKFGAIFVVNENDEQILKCNFMVTSEDYSKIILYFGMGIMILVGQDKNFKKVYIDHDTWIQISQEY